ncbi:ADP-ribosylglycohydrolase family protein [Leifsonia poae]|uniref:ADP-ribosylglycohydrolase family protein n=1 Tax=Leifsonia poae TaxID=110933 RepID=UPI003D6658F6
MPHTPRPSTSQAPTSRAMAARPRVSTRRPSPRAMRPGATLTSVIDTAIRLAKDGTLDAIEAVVAAAANVTDWRTGLGTLRAAVEPFDTVGPQYRQPAKDARIPSRTKSIEELPIALGMLVAANGDYRESVLGSINYGRDSDSIAVMAGSIAGALGGVGVVPAEWIDGVSEGSRMDITATGPVIASVARDVWAADAARARQVEEARGVFEADLEVA